MGTLVDTDEIEPVFDPYDRRVDFEFKFSCDENANLYSFCCPRVNENDTRIFNNIIRSIRHLPVFYFRLYWQQRCWYVYKCGDLTFIYKSLVTLVRKRSCFGDNNDCNTILGINVSIVNELLQSDWQVIIRCPIYRSLRGPVNGKILCGKAAMADDNKTETKEHIADPKWRKVLLAVDDICTNREWWHINDNEDLVRREFTDDEIQSVLNILEL
jgi:hypothetical protein